MKLVIERLIIEIIAAVLLVICVTVTSAAFAADSISRSANGLNGAFSVAQNASPTAFPQRRPGEG
jgi:hypothetical protein